MISLAKQYQDKGLSIDELVNEGKKGLLKSLDMLMNQKGSGLYLMLFGGFAKVWLMPLKKIRKEDDNKIPLIIILYKWL